MGTQLAPLSQAQTTENKAAETLAASTIATILCSLRGFQERVVSWDGCDHFANVEPLTCDQVDALIEQLNMGSLRLVAFDGVALVCPVCGEAAAAVGGVYVESGEYSIQRDTYEAEGNADVYACGNGHRFALDPPFVGEEAEARAATPETSA